MGKNIVHWWAYLISTELTMCGVRADVVETKIHGAQPFYKALIKHSLCTLFTDGNFQRSKTIC